MYDLESKMSFSHSLLSPVISSPGTNLISGQQVNLTCSLGYPLPFDLRVKWFSPEQPSLQVGTSGHLIIQEVGTRDSGKWRCELWQNNTQLTRTEITLRIGECRKWENGVREMWHDRDLVATISFTTQTWFLAKCSLFDECLFLLYTEPKLSVWMLVIICSVTVIVFLLLLVLTFILRRRRQVQYNPPCSFVKPTLDY